MPDHQSEILLTAALHYLALGWSVVPVNAEKRPLLRSWEEYQHRRPTEDEVREWWRLTPDANVAIVTGQISGLVVVDVDELDAAKQTLDELNTRPTLTVTTGGGGKHYYFKHPGGAVPNAVRLRPGVDIRGDGGYVVAPPSGHKSGRRYYWDDPGKAPLLLPLGLAGGGGPKGATKRLEPKDWQTDVPEGGRDQELTRRVGRLLQAGVPAGEVLTLARAINREHCKPPLEDAQVYKIVESIASREKAKEKTQTAPAFTVVTQREMLRRYSEDEDRWTVDEWLPESGCGLLVAPPGNFKTWILTAMAYSVTTGRPFLGRWAVHGKGPVLFIQQEDPWGMLQSRLARMFSPDPPKVEGGRFELDCRYVDELDSMPVYWYTDRDLRFSNKAIVERLEQKVAELRPRLVMMDPLYTMADSKDYMAEGAQHMAYLKKIRDRYQCSFVIAHHTTVAGSSSEDRSSIWGSQFLNAWLEFGWRMPKGDDDGNVVVRHFKSSDTPARIKVKFEITDYAFNVKIDDAPPGSVSERLEEAILSGAGQSSMRQLAKLVGCSPSAVSKVIKKIGYEKAPDGTLKPKGQ